MPRNSRRDRLRIGLIEALSPALIQFNGALHHQVRDCVQNINENYRHARNVMLATSRDNRYCVGLYLCYESTIEVHTGLEAGYIRWRYGRFSLNKSRRADAKPPITHRVPKSARTQLHYNLSDFSKIPAWGRSPDWEHRLVMYAEKKVRPLRVALHAHKEAQRLFLHAPEIPVVDTDFDDFFHL